MTIEVGPTVASKCMGFRHVQAFILFLGIAVAFGIRVNMSIAIVDMAIPTRRENYTRDWFGHIYLDWPISIQGIVLSSFIAGFVISQAAGYYLATKFGGKLLMTVGVAVSAALSSFIGLGAYDGGWILIALCRWIQGLAQGAMIPTVHHIFENWIPYQDRRLMETLVVTCGMQLGTSVQFLMSGFVIKYWGWRMTFYINTLTGIIWCVIYAIFGSNSAKNSKYMSEDEKLHICNSLLQDTERKNLKMPWHALWTSLPVFALVLACCAQQWGLWTLMTMIPMYLSLAYDADIVKIGLINAMSFFAMFVTVFPFRCISDCLIKKDCLSFTVTRKIFNTIGFLGPAICLVAISYLSFEVTLTSILLVLLMTLNSSQYFGFLSSHEDMAPNFSDTLKRTTVGIADVLAMFAPVTASSMMEDQKDLSDWSSVFNLSASLYIVSGLVFAILGTSVRQKWNDPETPTNESYSRGK